MNAIRFPNSTDGDYVVTLEVVYHMHCLNFLRKAVFFNYEYYQADSVFDDPVYSVQVRIGGKVQSCTRYSRLIDYGVHLCANLFLPRHMY